jgi:fructosamine-3-kinase
MEPALVAAIEDAIRAACGARKVISRIVAQANQHACQHWIADCGDERFFIKTLAASDQARLHSEADGLAAIAGTGAIRTPAAVASGNTAELAFLVLEYLPLRALTRDDGARCAEAVAQMHSLNQERYGWHRDNFLGASLQRNAWSDDWPSFFASHRLEPQLQAAARNGHTGDLQVNGERITRQITAFFLERRPQASLIHGDLWSGNIGVLENGEPVSFDPAIYFGDREVDFAMSELFGGLPESFYARYRAIAPLADGYAHRRTLYNFYHVLNHLNLYGASSRRHAERMAHELVNFLRR